MTRIRVSDRATGEHLADIDTALPHPDASADRARRAIVLPGAVPSTVRGRRSVEVVIDGWRFDVEVEDVALADLRERATNARSSAVHDGPTEVRAIIPGRVVSVAVVVGDSIKAGQRLLAVEAMKMENELRAPRDGTIEAIRVAPGQTVELGQPMVIIR
ncbi:MAG: biotin/lipoyl-binding protein [Chloroflexi bacterium]|nr:biotin/lipoyl-binding protein [Chloroflexota bacterium]